MRAILLAPMPAAPSSDGPPPERVLAFVLLTVLEHRDLRDALLPDHERVVEAAKARGLLDPHGTPTAIGRALLDPAVLRTELAARLQPIAAQAPRRNVSASELPDARTLELPRSARALYERLRNEPVGDWPTLLQECREHTAAFEAGLAINEFLPVEEARRLMAGLATLHERAKAHRDPAFAERLVWIAARYFVIKLDGTADFEVVGLDDDVAVFDAVCKALGYDDLRIHGP